MDAKDEKFIQLCKSVANLTDKNYHTLAKKEIADFFGYYKLAGIFQNIEDISNIDGYLCSELSQLRCRKGIEMMQHIKEAFGDDIYEKLNNSL